MGCSPSTNGTYNVDSNIANANPLKSTKQETISSLTTDFIENSILVWLTDPLLNEVASYNAQLRHVVSALKIFDNPNTCYTFLTSIRDEIIFLILSTKHEHFLKQIHHLRQIYKIYILDLATEKNKDDQHDKSPYINVFRNINTLCNQLAEDRELAELDSLSFFTINPSTRNGISKKCTGAFLIGQHLRFIVIPHNFKSNAKTLFANFCRTKYADDKEQLRCIDDFDENYRPEEALKWLTGNSFVSQIFNRLQRVPDIDLMYHTSFMMKHVHMLLVSSNDGMNSLLVNTSSILYRGKTMLPDEFNSFTEDITGSFLSSRAFLVAKKNKNLIVDFLRQIITDRPGRIAVLFEIHIDSTTIKTAPLALIKNTDHNIESKSDEFCFTLGTIFRVESIEKNKDFSIDIWIVKMTVVTNEVDPKLSHILKQMRTDDALANPAFYFAKLFMDAGYLDRASKYFFQLLEDKSIFKQPSRFVRISCAVGDVLMMKNEFEKAVDYYEKALNSGLGVLKPEHFDLIPIYNSLGECYSKTNMYALALENFEKAAQLMRENNVHSIDEETMKNLDKQITEMKKLLQDNRQHHIK